MENTNIKEDYSEALAQWADNNPVTIYGDYNDELPDDMIQLLLDGDIDGFSEAQSDTEMNMSCYESYSYENEALKQACSELGLEYDDLTEDEIEAFMSTIYRDYSDFWNTCLRNSRPHIVAIPEKANGEDIEFPNMDFDKRTNSRINDYLRSVHGWDGWQAETLYIYDVLKVIGTIDLQELLENLIKGKKPYGVKLDSGYLITHNSFNGSGGLGDIPYSKSKHTYKAHFLNDENRKYGVQSVFGFVESVWREEIHVIYK